MPTPLEFRDQYFNIAVEIECDDHNTMTCSTSTYHVQLNEYFMMNWVAGRPQRDHYDAVTAGSTRDIWFSTHQQDIRSAAMGKGSPDDYGLALEWAVHSGRVRSTQAAIQRYFDDNMGIDCSGFATNYLIADGRMPNTNDTKRNHGASGYFNLNNAVNDVTDIQQGDLLIFMNGAAPMQQPAGVGHVMVVESLDAQCSAAAPYGSMRVVESTGSNHAETSLSDSVYTINRITPTGSRIGAHGPQTRCMVLTVTRLTNPNFHVSVMRVPKP
jgi:hypothetical protein